MDVSVLEAEAEVEVGAGSGVVGVIAEVGCVIVVDVVLVAPLTLEMFVLVRETGVY